MARPLGAGSRGRSAGTSGALIQLSQRARPIPQIAPPALELVRGVFYIGSINYRLGGHGQKNKITCKIPKCKAAAGLRACYRCKELACRHHLNCYSSPAPHCSKCRLPGLKPLRVNRAYEHARVKTNRLRESGASDADIEPR